MPKKRRANRKTHTNASTVVKHVRNTKSSIKKNKRANYRAPVILLLLGLALTMYVVSGYYHTSLNPTQLISLNDLNGLGIGNYTSASTVSCSSSQLLANYDISSVCTEAFVPSTPFPNVTPYMITVFAYHFNNAIGARGYIENVTTMMNDTPWPQGDIILDTPSGKLGNATVYYTTMRANSSATQAIVTTAYVLNGDAIVATAAMLPLGNNSIPYGHGLVSTILKSQYALIK